MKKKVLAVCLVVALCAVAVIGSTVAYFTDKDAATNVFTMGKVDITLTEPNWDEQLGDADKLQVFPGLSYAKDPRVTVEADSEDCWLAATVTISNLADLQALYADDTTGVKQAWGLSLVGNGKMMSGGVADLTATAATLQGKSGTKLGDTALITYAEDAAADTITYTYYFLAPHTANDVEILFSQVNVPSIIDNGDISGDLTIDVKAYAVQAAGLDQAAAFTELDTMIAAG